MTLTPRTELDAVNHMLENLGEAPVLGLEGELPLDALKARNKLRMVKEEVLARGWFWNTEVHTLSPPEGGFAGTPSKRIQAPEGALSIKPIHREGFSLSIRNGFLYRTQPHNNGDEFDRPVQVELILDLNFEDLPAVAKTYVTRKAAREFQIQELGNDTLIQQDMQEENNSWAALVSEDNFARPNSIRNNPDLRSILGPNRRRPEL